MKKPPEGDLPGGFLIARLITVQTGLKRNKKMTDNTRLRIAMQKSGR
ncbi:ATP phosphoribosyltransferase, partial [Escherichia coli]